ncbi:hypothetical protein C0992_008122, partial [Termitomyces sp. T32_za158]
MFAIDGNNLLRRVGLTGDRQVGDLRTFDDSDYYLSTDFVDQFAGEVKKTRSMASSSGLLKGDLSNDQEDISDKDAGDPTDGMINNNIHVPCAENWKAAANESSKKMWAIFNETGIFASACRHGLILWIIDMMRSGE